MIGVADATVREKLLFEKDLTLAKAVDILRACEASRLQLENIWAAGAVQAVHQLTKGAQLQRDKPHAQQDGGGTRDHEKGGSWSRDSPNTRPGCGACGRRHGKDHCRAAGITCNACGSKGRFARFCKWRERAVHDIEDDEASNQDDSVIVDSLTSEPTCKEWVETFELENIKLAFKLDTGASCNVLPVSAFQRIPERRRRLRPGPRVKSYGADGRWLKVLGVQACKIRHRGKL